MIFDCIHVRMFVAHLGPCCLCVLASNSHLHQHVVSQAHAVVNQICIRVHSHQLECLLHTPSPG